MATKVRIYPTPEQAQFLNRQFGATRFVYNKALRIISTQYKRHGTTISAKKHIKPLLPIAKKSRKYHWLKDFDSIALQQACINLDKAFQNFFDPKLAANYPKLKRKHGKQSSYHCTGVSAGEDWIKVPKVESIKARVHRRLTGKLKSITLSRTSTGKYYASLLTKDVKAKPMPLQTIDTVVGIDMGLTHLIIDSNGDKVTLPHSLKRAKTNLKHKQRALSRCTQGSKRRRRARLKCAKAYERLTNARADFQHKLSRRLIDENQAVVVETLKMNDRLEDPQISKRLVEVSWYSLIQKLEYKAKAQGKHLIRIDHKVDSLSLSFKMCASCCSQHDHKINTAINIRKQGVLKLRAEGLSVSANGGLCKPGHAPVAA